jgi:hypothetical protein
VIPTLLLVGLGVGVLIHDPASLRRSLAVAAALSLLWGVVVGVAAANALTAVGGTALGLANVVVGAAVGAAVGATWRAAGLARHGRSSAR